MSQHLPVLQVVLPLVAALLAALVRRPGWAWALAFAAAWSALAIAIGLLARVLGEGTISYHLGGWEPPYGIEYRVDLLNAFVLLIVSAMAAAVMPFARKSVAREIAAERIPLFYSALLLCLAGLLGITGHG